ncbi:MEKHLA domain-containing protein [Aphanothece hegewaldii CCALA 016]|uniref:MEKHLA domain-containing protein n=1 Tax=Aphanothece hegewaldii CCALA 016 TaxID=2107694 RepID=A0A2T1LZR7_9CHRO|nr:MEKHLA domain-containing protein [Aphanothece hegewaldii]PSF37911.1 MEKHLA domain-containing protein [Aphanothece hegewaldii CCALA 016]
MSEIWQKPEIIDWTQNLLNSYEKLLKKALIARKSDLEEQAKTLFFAPFVVASHGIEKDPIFNYGNQTTLDLWEISWENLLKTPSRKTVKDNLSEAERAKMLLQAKEKGFIDHYQGIRITSKGKLFKINNAIVWNITNHQGTYLGQAATFSEWEFLS